MTVLAFAPLDYARAAGAPPAPPPRYDEAARVPPAPPVFVDPEGELTKRFEALRAKFAAMAAEEAQAVAATAQLPEPRDMVLRWLAEAIAEHFGRARAAHAQHMDDELRGHEQRMAAREKALEQREAALVAAEAEHATRRDDLARRIKLVRQAGAV